MPRLHPTPTPVRPLDFRAGKNLGVLEKKVFRFLGFLGFLDWTQNLHPEVLVYTQAEVNILYTTLRLSVRLRAAVIIFVSPPFYSHIAYISLPVFYLTPCRNLKLPV